MTNWKTQMLPQIGVACLVPCGADKAPLEKAWQQRGYTAEEVAAMGDRVRAVGINTAKANLVCIDLDGPDAFDFIEAHKLPLPPTWVIGRSNDANRMKRVYRVTADQRDRLPVDAGKWKKGSLEVFWRSQQFIVMGEHPSGGCYTWDGTPKSIADLPDEWLDFLPHRRTASAAVVEFREIDLQKLLTKQHSMLVDSGLGGEGSRNNLLFELAADVYAAEDEARRRATYDIRIIGSADELIEETLKRTDITGITRTEIEQTLRSARDGRTLAYGFEDRWAWCIGRKRPNVEAQRLAAAPSCKWTAIAELLPSGWYGKDDSKKHKLDCGSASQLLESALGDRLRYNTMGYEVELDGMQMDNAERMRFLGGIQNRGYNLTDDVLYQALMSASQPNSFHPVREYLLGLPEQPALDTLALANVLLGVEDVLSNLMLQRFLVGAVRRALEPGCKMDYCCILHGSQGHGKSEFWKALFGPEFYQSFNSDETGKDNYLRLHRSWGIELAEFDGMTRRGSAGLKNFITTSSDTLRPPYGRKTEVMPRPSVFAGTCNTDDFLRDTTGERRYWVIAIDSAIDIGKTKQMRDAIWYSILQDVARGDLPFLPREIEVESAERNIEYSMELPLLNDVAALIKTYGGRGFIFKNDARNYMLSQGVCTAAQVDSWIKPAMKAHGWVGDRQRSGSHRGLTYWRPDMPTHSAGLASIRSAAVAANPMLSGEVRRVRV